MMFGNFQEEETKLQNPIKTLIEHICTALGGRITAMIDTKKLKKPTIDARGNLRKEDLGREVICVSHGREIEGKLSGWQDGMMIIKLKHSKGFLCDYVFVPSSDCYFVWL